MILLMVLFCCVSCQEEESPDLGSCGNSKVIKKAHNQLGRFYYNSHFNRYTISVAEANTIDVVDVGLVCNTPAITAAPTVAGEGVPVLFSGKYRQSDEVSPVAGRTYYELELSKIEFIE